MDLTPCLPRAIWIDRFTMRAGQLLPDLSPDQVGAYAPTVFAEAADLEPEEAAEIFALELPPEDPGATGN